MGLHYFLVPFLLANIFEPDFCNDGRDCCWEFASRSFCKLLSHKVYPCSRLLKQRSIKKYCIYAHIICESSWLLQLLLMLSRKSWSYLQILQDSNTHTFGVEVSYDKTVSVLRWKSRFSLKYQEMDIVCTFCCHHIMWNFLWSKYQAVPSHRTFSLISP